MAFTVTCAYPGSDPSPGSSVKIFVLANAIEAGGNQVSNSGTGAPSWTFTPNGSNSFICLSVFDRTGGSAGEYAAASNNTLVDNTTSHDAMCDGYYSGATVASTPVTVGCSAPTGTNTQLWASYEVLASGGSMPTLDASTPVLAKTLTFTTTTASFDPPPGSVLVAMCTGNNPTGDPTLSDTSGLSLTWTKQSFNLASGSGEASVYTTTVPVTGTDSGPNSPTTGTDLGGGTGSWTNPGRIVADDASVAVWTVV